METASQPTPSVAKVDDLHRLAGQFREAARNLFLSSPLYRDLSLAIAEDTELLALAARAKPGQSAVLMLLGSVHYLVLGGASHPLAAYYGELAAGRPPKGDAFPLLRDFCRQHEPALAELIASRRVQTNEIGRSIYVRLAMDWLGAQGETRPVSFVDVGASAGLNLAWDRYAIRLQRRAEQGGEIAEERWLGDRASGVEMRCEVLSGEPPSLRGAIAPPVAERLGLELDPPDLRSADDVRWLSSFLWADQPDRLQRFRAAVEMVRDAGWRLERSNAARELAQACGELRSDTLLCLAHTILVTQLTEEVAGQLAEQMAILSRDRDFVQVALERPRGVLLLSAARWSAGEKVAEDVLATCDSHGRWVEWGAGAGGEG